MLFFVGAFFLFLAMVMLIKFLVFSQRPKQEVQVKEFFMAKLKTDLIGIGPEQKHARVSYTVDGKEYQGEIPLMKNTKTQVGENIRITYSKTNPTLSRLYDPRKELLMILIMFIFGGGITGVSLVLSDILSR